MTKITDGKEVAKLFLDWYLNDFRGRHEELMEILSGQERQVRDNFTYLGFAWLKGLSEVSYYDLRNEASKLLADDICEHVRRAPELHCFLRSGNTEMEVSAEDDAQVAQLLIRYLKEDSKSGYKNFVSYALWTHRTLQQNLTRLFGEWFCKIKDESPFLKEARRAYAKCALPFI